MSHSRALLSLVVVVAVSASAQPARKRVTAKLSESAAHAEVVAAVKAQNALALPIVAVKVIDQRWFLGRESGLMKQTIAGKCADHLRELVAANPEYAEAFVMDNQGAVVCASAKTAIYWFGEQPLWERAFRGETFRDPTAISVPVKDEGRPIGAIAIRVKLTS